MKKYIVLILVVSVVLITSVSAYSYFALSFDCADKDEYGYSEEAFYYPDLNVILDYDDELGMYYFYDTEFKQRIYVPDYPPATATDIASATDIGEV